MGLADGDSKSAGGAGRSAQVSAALSETDLLEKLRDKHDVVVYSFGDDLAKGDVNWKATLKALKAIKYSGALTAEMIPFSRLPNLVLPDMKLARDTAGKMKKILGRK